MPQSTSAAMPRTTTPASGVMTPASLRFERFELQPAEHRLLVDGVPAPPGGRALLLLEVLLARPGHLFKRQELMDRVWPDVVVEENNLSLSGRICICAAWLTLATGRGQRLNRAHCSWYFLPSWAFPRL